MQALELQRALADAPTMPNAPGPRLPEQLERIRAERWATSMGEREEGVSAVATAVVDSRDRVVAALCISAPTTRLGAERFEEMRNPLEACAVDEGALLKRG